MKIVVSSVFLAVFIACTGCTRRTALSTSAELESSRLDKLMYGSLPPGMTEREAELEIVRAFPRQRRRAGMEEYEAVHMFAATALPFAVEIERKFGSADHFITHYRFASAKTNIWNTVTYFGDRYTLKVEVEIQIDYTRKEFRVIGEPEFHLMESGDIRRDGGGPVRAHHRFNLSAFEELVDANWCFSTIGIPIDPTPAANFNIQKAMSRAPIYPISLLESQLKRVK